MSCTEKPDIIDEIIRNEILKGLKMGWLHTTIDGTELKTADDVISCINSGREVISTAPELSKESEIRADRWDFKVNPEFLTLAPDGALQIPKIIRC